MSTMKDIARVLALRTQMTQRDSEAFVSEIFDVVKEALNVDGQVKIKGLGMFKLQKVRDRESIDVNTGKRVLIASHDRISFTPDTLMKDAVNKPFAHFETVILNDGVSFDDTPEENEAEIPDTTASDTTVEDIPQEEVPQIEVPQEEIPQEEPQVENVEVQAVVEPEPVVDEGEEESSSDSVPEVSATVETEAWDTDTETSADTSTETTEDTGEDISEDDSQDTQDAPSDDVPEPTHEVLETSDDVPEVPEATPDIIEAPAASSNISWSRILGMTAACFVIFAAGVFVGRITAPQPETIQEPKIEQSDTACAIVTDTVKVQPSDTVKSSPTPKDSVKVTAPAPVKSEEKKSDEATPPAKSATQYSDKYNYDARVRTGAYVIIGTRSEHIVKAGQTLQSISRFYLGEGMECYVEVFNGDIREVKPGDKLKIPELKNKKQLKK